jgi:hypothetical protein
VHHASKSTPLTLHPAAPRAAPAPRSLPVAVALPGPLRDVKAAHAADLLGPEDASAQEHKRAGRAEGENV